MRLVTFDMMICVSNKCQSSMHPLILKVIESCIVEQEPSRELIEKTLLSLDWKRFIETCQENKMLFDLSAENKPQMLNEELIEKLNKALYEFHVVKGELMCPSCQRAYPIVNSIPNMLITDEPFIEENI